MSASATFDQDIPNRPQSPANVRDASVTGSNGRIDVKGDDSKQLIGRDFKPVDKRKFSYDVAGGRAAGLPVGVTRDDRMSTEEAGAMLTRLHSLCGIEGQTEDIMYAFDQALWICHTVNSGSTLVPGRSTFSVPGHVRQFEFSVIMNCLGIDSRRFFRAFADNIKEANNALIESFDPGDPVSVEMCGWLRQVAFERGLHRQPHLAHDSADACSNLSYTERLALFQSKRHVLDETKNVADMTLAARREEKLI